MKLTEEQCICHELALRTASQYEEKERNLVEVLIRAEELELPRAFELASVFAYSVKELGLTKSVTGMVIFVARKAQRFPELRASIQAKLVSVSKAHKFCSSLSPENVGDWIEFAKTHTSCEIEDRVREQNPKEAKARKFHLSLKAEKLLKRAQSIESQRRRSPVSREEALEAALELFIEKRDPVVRADRQKRKKEISALKSAAISNTASNETSSTDKLGTDPSTNKTLGSSFLRNVPPKGTSKREVWRRYKRVAPTADQKNAVLTRDRGCCRYVNQKGERCGQDLFTETHHLIKVSDGGSNDPENLLTLCSFHHDLVHQLNLPLEIVVPVDSKMP